MKKTFFTAALAFVLSLGGLVLSADDDSLTNNPRLLFHNNAMMLVVASETDSDLTTGLSKLAGTEAGSTSQRTFGYILDSGDFCSLADAISEAKVDTETNTARISLGKFDATKLNEYQFGFVKDGEFTPVGPSLNVASDPLFYGEFSSEGFYQLDFSNDPFDGKIEVLVMGEPLPASTVTMLVALAAAGAFLLYRNRRTRARFSAQA